MKNISWNPAENLFNAAEFGNLPMVQTYLSQGASPDGYRGYYGDTAIMAACREGHSDIVKLLLEHGARTDIQGKHSTGLLNLALRAFRNSGEQVSLILIDHLWEESQDLKWDKRGFNEAVQRGFLRVVQRLLDCDASLIHQHDLWDQAPLMCAAIHGQLELMKLLLARGANVNEQNNKGCTALVGAVQNTTNSAAKILLDHGADVNLLDSSGDSPLRHAIVADCYETVELLIARGAQINTNSVGLLDTNLNKAIRSDVRILVLLLEHGAHIDSLDAWGRTPLIEAAQYGYKESLKVLLTYKPALDCRDLDGFTALHRAVQGTSSSVVKSLLQAGSNLFAKSFAGRTPVQAASWRPESRKLAMLLTAASQAPAFDSYLFS